MLQYLGVRSYSVKEPGHIDDETIHSEKNGETT